MASEGVLATLQAGWQALGTCGAERAVIGGLALSAWNHARYTRDADVLIAIDRGRIDELVQSLTADYERIRQDAFPGEADPPAVR